MKRRVVLILLLLAAGAIVNVAVAWGCSLYGQNPRNRSGDQWDRGLLTHEQHQWLESVGWEVTADRCLFWERGRGSGYEWVQFYDVDASNGPTLNGHAKDNKLPVRRTRCGWPAFGLEHQVWRGELIVAERRFAERKVGLLEVRLPKWLAGPQADLEPSRLSLLPVWPGFAINTVFYALMLWLLFAAPFALRRRRRIKRGLCPKCSYPVGSNDVCTECGAAVNKSS